MQAPRKTDLARQLLAPGQRQLTPALRALLIVVDGKRDASALRDLGKGLGLGDTGVQQLADRGLIEIPKPAEDPQVQAQAQQERGRRLVAAKFFALDLVTRMLAGREADLRNRMREADTESRFMEWVDLCCERIEEHADGERAAMFRTRVQASYQS